MPRTNVTHHHVYNCGHSKQVIGPAFHGVTREIIDLDCPECRKEEVHPCSACQKMAHAVDTKILGA